MSQQINFLRTNPQKAIQLPASWIILICMALGTLLVLTTFFMGAAQLKYSLAVKHAMAHNKKVVNALQQTEKENPLLASNMTLKDRVNAVEKELQEKKDYYISLTRPGLREGFSSYLGELSTIVPEGVWLKEITIEQEAKITWLDGFMVKPSAVSMFLQALQNSFVFKGTTYHLSSIKKMPGKSYTEFNITNTALNADEPAIAVGSPTDD